MTVSGPAPRPRPRGGFTLIEVLVTLVLLALLIGVVVPAVMRQLDRGDAVRVSEDVEAVRNGVRLFRVDVRRWPANLTQVMVSPENDGWGTEAGDYDDFGNNEIPQGLWARWNGPYLDDVVLDAAGDLNIGVGGTVANEFESHTIGTDEFVTIRVAGLTEELTGEVSLIIDGHAVVTMDDAGGRVRWDATDGSLLYLMTRAN